MSHDPRRRSRIVIETPRNQRGARPNGRQRTHAREGIVALSIIGAAALATFIALFLTSRPYDPANSTLVPVQTVPAGSLALQPSPKPSASTSPSPQSNQTAKATPSPAVIATAPDDTQIQSQIERTLDSDPTLSKLDISVLVEGGKATVWGSVRTTDLKQRVEKAVRSVKGVLAVDNQLVVTDATP